MKDMTFNYNEITHKTAESIRENVTRSKQTTEYSTSIAYVNVAQGALDLWVEITSAARNSPDRQWLKKLLSGQLELSRPAE